MRVYSVLKLGNRLASCNTSMRAVHTKGSTRHGQEEGFLRRDGRPLRRVVEREDQEGQEPRRQERPSLSAECGSETGRARPRFEEDPSSRW